MGLLFLLYIGYKRDLDSQYVLDETEIGTLFALTLS